MAQMTTLSALNEQQASQDRAWEALQLLQRDLGPSTSEFKSIWEGCLDRLTEPFLDPEARTLYTATFSGDSYGIRQILQNHPDWVTVKDASGWNLLQWSCFFGHERMVEAFLAQVGDGEEAGVTDLRAFAESVHTSLEYVETHEPLAD